MPFKSKAQQRFMFAAESKGELPKGTAKRWAHHTPDIKALPEHAPKAAPTPVKAATAPRISDKTRLTLVRLSQSAQHSVDRSGASWEGRAQISRKEALLREVMKFADAGDGSVLEGIFGMGGETPNAQDTGKSRAQAPGLNPGVPLAQPSTSGTPTGGTPAGAGTSMDSSHSGQLASGDSAGPTIGGGQREDTNVGAQVNVTQPLNHAMVNMRHKLATFGSNTITGAVQVGFRNQAAPSQTHVPALTGAPPAQTTTGPATPAGLSPIQPMVGGIGSRSLATGGANTTAAGMDGRSALMSTIQTKGPISTSGDFGNPNAGQGVPKMGAADRLWRAVQPTRHADRAVARRTAQQQVVASQKAAVARRTARLAIAKIAGAPLSDIGVPEPQPGSASINVADIPMQHRLGTIPAVAGAATAMPMVGVGGGLGALLGAIRGNTAEGLGRGVIRGGSTGMGMGAGAVLGAQLGDALGASPTTGAGLGALAGGAAGYFGSGAVLGPPAGRAKKPVPAKEEEGEEEKEARYLETKSAVAANDINNMQSWTGLAADAFRPDTWGGHRAGRAQQMAEASGQEPGFNVKHPMTASALSGLGGAAVGGLGGVGIGALAGGTEDPRAMLAGGVLGAGVGGIAGHLANAFSRRSKMKEINEGFDTANAAGQVQAKKPELSTAATLLAPARGPHRAGQADAYEAISNDTPVSHSYLRSLGYLAPGLVPQEYQGLTKSLVGYGQSLNSHRRIANVGKKEEKPKAKAEPAAKAAALEGPTQGSGEGSAPAGDARAQLLRALAPILVGGGAGAAYGAIKAPGGSRLRGAIAGGGAGAGAGAGLAAGNAFLTTGDASHINRSPGVAAGLPLATGGIGMVGGLHAGRRLADLLGVHGRKGDNPDNDLQELDLSRKNNFLHRVG